jgi:hypothetical protein
MFTVVGALPPGADARSPGDSANSGRASPNDAGVAVLLPGSPADESAPTVGVIGDSVAGNYAYYLVRELGPAGVRVASAMLYSCPVGTQPIYGKITPQGVILPRNGACPELVRRIQESLVSKFHPKVILWQSLTDNYGIADGKKILGVMTPEWEKRVLAEWDKTLTRVTRENARVVLILPLWYAHTDHTNSPFESVMRRYRSMHLQWAARHRDQVAVADVAPLVCPSGPACEVPGLDYRPDGVHFGDQGGPRVAAYLMSHVRELREIAGRT